MEFKGTKGRWYLQEFTDVYTNIIRCDNGEHSTIYIASTLQSSSKETRYNALLMSKSPEMLEMLQKISIALEEIWNNDDSNYVFDLVDAVELDNLIKKATEL
ncbi:MAG: hypothetical protein ACRCVU_15500 [Flavobacterium sp.]